MFGFPVPQVQTRRAILYDPRRGKLLLCERREGERGRGEGGGNEQGGGMKECEAGRRRAREGEGKGGGERKGEGWRGGEGRRGEGGGGGSHNSLGDWTLFYIKIACHRSEML